MHGLQQGIPDKVMKAVKIYPKPHTAYKYRLREVFAKIGEKDRARLQTIKQCIQVSIGISKMTLYRWNTLKHGDKADIPTSSLKVISMILTLAGYPCVVNQLINYVVGEATPEEKVSSEK